MKALGIDIGSSSIKGAVLDLTTSTVSVPVVRAFPAPVSGLPAGWVEVDPESVCRRVHEVLELLLQQAPDAKWLGFSSQMGGLILFDESIQPLTNYMSWRDQRSLENDGTELTHLTRVRSDLEAAGYLSELGQELQPGSTTVLLAWLRSQRRLPNRAIPGTIADFVIARLVGHSIPMHATHAIGMLDLRLSQWHWPALELLGLNGLKVPALALTEDAVGEVTVSGTTLSVFGAYGDQQCALRGAALQPDELSLNISTGSQVSRRSSDFHPGPYQSRKYFFGDTLDTITHLPAGRSLNALVDLLTELAREAGCSIANPWDLINRKVEQVVETDLNVDLSFFRGPLGERGCIDNISTENLSVGTLFHAAFRAMADNYVSVAQRFSAMTWRKVVLSGGLTQNAPRLRRLLEERFAVPLRDSVGEETLAGLLDIARASFNSRSAAT